MYRLIIEAEQKKNRQIYLNSQQIHYLQRVIRLKVGDRFIAMDGEGNSWLVSLEGDQALIREDYLNPSKELSYHLTLVTAIAKGDGFADLVRICTELGVSQIIPTLTQRTINQPSSNKVERWRKIAQEAVEQSEREIVPQILDPTPFNQVITQFTTNQSSNYICLARQKTPHLLSCLKKLTTNQIFIATGPEGGWTPEEIEIAITSGFQGVNLGQRILRSVTAPIMASSLVAAICES
jgi:16S rRNA (uracil1498-N3)-methyltransferase